MSSTYLQITYQIVFGTKHRRPTISPEYDCELHNYIAGILLGKKCHPFCINGVEDHIHIMTSIHPSVCLSDLVKDIKLSSSTSLLKGNPKFPLFDYWQEGYGAFTYAASARKNLFNYIKNQKQHHRKETFVDEFRRLLMEHDVEFDPKYLL